MIEGRVWLKQAEAVYKEKGGWEELKDFEDWLCEQLGEENAKVYKELDPYFQHCLYGVFCNLADKIK